MARNKGSKDVAYIAPVEHYRKQIGKQDYKKSKAELKESKARSQAKEATPRTLKETSVMLGAMVVVMGVIYVILYLYLDKMETRDTKDS